MASPTPGLVQAYLPYAVYAIPLLVAGFVAVIVALIVLNDCASGFGCPLQGLGVLLSIFGVIMQIVGIVLLQVLRPLPEGSKK